MLLDGLLDVPLSRGQRVATFRFTLVDGVTGLRRGEVHPLRGTAPSLQHDTGRTIARQLNLTFGIQDSSAVDTLTDRILLHMVLADGRELPLGRYMFIDATRAVTSAGHLIVTTLSDEMFILDQPITESFSATFTADSLVRKAPVRVDDAIREVLADQDVAFEIEPTEFTTISSWSSGTHKAKILADLALQGAYFNPWFDHNGILRFKRVVDPATVLADIDLDDPPRIYRDSIAYTNDLLTAPNRFVVISNTGDESAPRVGTYDIPSSAPHSIASRGFIIADVREMQLTESDQAAAVAEAIGVQSAVFERIELSTPPDPRHDSYNVVAWDGKTWLETAWSMELREGGVMRHSLKRIYS